MNKKFYVSLFAILCLLMLASRSETLAQTVLPIFPQINTVAPGTTDLNPIISDGNGGWYIGGSFTTMGGATHNRIAHILKDYSVDPTFNTSFSSGTIRTLAIVGNRLFANGFFSTVAGKPSAPSINRSGFVAIDLTPGSNYGFPILTWGVNTNISGGNSINQGTYLNVMTPSVDGTALYIGGAFGLCNGETRENLAALSTLDGSLIETWDPEPDGFVTNPENPAGIDLSVHSIVTDGQVVYVAGAFQTIAGVNKQGLADLNASDGQIATGSTFNPQGSTNILDGYVLSVLLDGNNLYVGGAFTNMGDQVRNKLALIDKKTGIADPLFFKTGSFPVGKNPYSIEKFQNTIYLSGIFNSVSGSAHLSMVSLDAIAGNVLSCWAPDAAKNGSSTLGTVNSFFIANDSTMIVAGGYNNICGEAKALLQLITLSGTPKIYSVNPQVACTDFSNPTAVAQLNGINFYPGTTVTYKGKPVTFSITNRRTIKVTLPTAGLVSDTFIVSNSCGKDTIPMVITGQPTITAVSTPPPCIPAEDSTVMITVSGTNFMNILGVTFNGFSVPFTIQNPSTLILTIPLADAGTDSVRVTSACGKLVSPGPITIKPRDQTIPFISSLSVYTGAPGTPVTITGQNFSPVPSNNLVYFGAVTAQVSSATPITLQVTVPAGATSIAPVRVTNVCNDLQYVRSQGITPYFKISFTCGTLDSTTYAQTVQTYTTGTNPIGVAAADFNNDGLPDLAVANYTDGTVTVYTRNTTGDDFLPVTNTYPADSGSADIKLADFNGDGLMDIATANNHLIAANGSITVLMHNPTANGGFAAPVSYKIKGDPNGLTVGDFNGDGRPDIAVSEANADSVFVLLRNANNNGFVTEGQYTVQKLGDDMTSGDFNNDGLSDIAVVNAKSNSISVLLRAATGKSFLPATSYATGYFPESITVGDFNSDGKLDLIVTNYAAGTSGVPANAALSSISVLINTGSGFAAAVNYNMSGQIYPYETAVGDYNSDGQPDFAVSYEDDSQVGYISIFTRNAANTGFDAPIKYPVTGTTPPFTFGPNGLVTADFNKDGYPDLATAGMFSNSVSVLTYTNPFTPIKLTGNSFVCLGSAYTFQITAPPATSLQPTLHNANIGAPVNTVNITTPVSITIPAAMLNSVGLDTVVIKGSTVTCTKSFSLVVQVLPLPTAALSVLAKQPCGTTSPSLNFTFMGVGPWQVVYTANGVSHTDTFATASAAKTIPALVTDTSVTYTLVSVNTIVNGQLACAGSVGPTVKTTLFPGKPSIGVVTPASACIATSGPTASVQITGNNFYAGTQVTFRGNTLPITLTGRQMIQTTVPLSPSGVAYLVISNSCGKDSVAFGALPTPTASISVQATQFCGVTAPTITIGMTGQAPWQVTYSDGTTTYKDTFATSPVQRQLTAPIADTAVTYTLLSVTTLVNNTPTCLGTVGPPATTVLKPGPPKISLTGGLTPAFTCAPSLPGTPQAVKLTGINLYGGETTISYRGSTVSATITNRTTANFVLPVTATGVSYVTVSNSCGSDSVPFTAVPSPSAAFSIPDKQPCGNITGELTVTLTGIAPWNITYTDGAGSQSSTFTSSPGQIPITAPATPGPVTYILQSVNTVINGVNACSGTLGPPAQTTFEEQPVAAFGTNPPYTQLLFGSNSTVQFFDASQKADHYLWDFGDGVTATTAGNQTHTYLNKGKYTPKLTVWNADSSCFESYSLNGPFEVTAADSLLIPNVYTPNDDGFNDEYYVTATNVKQFQIYIYDRWGTEVWDSPLLHTGWRGKTKGGSTCPVGVYFYSLKLTFGDGTEINRQGNITLVR